MIDSVHRIPQRRLRTWCAAAAAATAALVATPAAASSPLPSPPPESVVVVRAARVLPIDGPSVADGMIVIRGGRIEAVGRDLPVPEGALVIDVPGGWATPGLIESHSNLGLRDESSPGSLDELSDPNAAGLRVLDGVNPFDRRFARARDAGVTALFICPGRGNVIAGRGAVVKPAGRTVEEMALAPAKGVKLSLGEGPKDAFGAKGRLPSTRMGSAYVVRKALVQAGEYLARRKAHEASAAKESDAPAFTRDLALETLADLLEGRETAFIECYRADDIMTALRLGDEFGLRMVLLGCAEGFKVAGEIARRGVPVIVGPLGIGPKRLETQDVTIGNAAALADAGVTVAIQAEDVSGAGALEELTLAAALAVRGGLDRAAALRAITLTPAEILGVADRIGSLSPGKDADVVIFDGDPLHYRTRVAKVLIDGRVVFERK